MDRQSAEHLETLGVADPHLAERLAQRLARKTAPVPAELVGLLVADTLWALGVEISFGEALAAGFADLAGEAPAERLETYRAWLREAGDSGPTLGRILAGGLPAILRCGRDDLIAPVRELCAEMTRKGVFTLRDPLNALGRLLEAGDHAAAAELTGLLRRLFSSELTYEESRYFSRALPEAALAADAARRGGQLAALGRLIAENRRLVAPFLSGLDKGLRLLSAEGLAAFVSAALAGRGPAPGAQARFLALESKSALEIFASLQVSVGFFQVRDSLQRYLRARTGLPLAVRPRSALPPPAAALVGASAKVCSDGEAIYLPEEIGWRSRPEENALFFKHLLRLEASFHEFGTLDFDLERLREIRRGDRPDGKAPAPRAGEQSAGSATDLAGFLRLFPDPDLAGDLFTVFELGRLRRRLRRHYPGLVRRIFPLLRRELRRPGPDAGASPFLGALLARISLGEAPAATPADAARPGLETLFAAFDRGISAESPVEASAGLVIDFYEAAAAELLRENPNGGRRPGLATPFGWRPWPNPAAAFALPADRRADELRAALARKGLHVYRSGIRRRLSAVPGRGLSLQDLRELSGRGDLGPELLEGILDAQPAEPAAASEDAAAHWYPEWDVGLGDYLQRHVRLQERPPEAVEGFYEAVLARHGALIVQTRRAFERMRPEGLKRLRQWPDGDEMDHLRLTEAVIDRRRGETPSDRLYIKRVKERRDVAVLVLVDVSRSTANRVAGAERSVLEVEKEAIVVLSEALAVLGDAFAVAGFSGTGRLGVDYYPVKGFEEPLSAVAKARIGGLRPQRNTRMGAAIRHAGRQLEQAPARLRLLILLGDGFPNDRDYKQAYALADTRRALMELRARGIRVHALTVNLPADPDLDGLYGKVSHYVITDVRELPERLIRAYSALTRT
jgi:hypothetical protein